jgi:thiol:disulfide interchange protein
MKTLCRKVGITTVMAALAWSSATIALAASQDWNDAQIKWTGYETGLADAKKSGKPICLIFYTTWCPHCTTYSTLFNDPRVVEKSKSFVMIRLDKDQNAELSKKYAPDGEYIPRTYFLDAKGELDDSLTENRPQYKYFYDTQNPASLLAGMDRALGKIGGKP